MLEVFVAEPLEVVLRTKKRYPVDTGLHKLCCPVQGRDTTEHLLDIMIVSFARGQDHDIWTGLEVLNCEPHYRQLTAEPVAELRTNHMRSHLRPYGMYIEPRD